MKFGWGSEEERLARFMKLPTRKKLEWLYEMQEFTRKCMTKRHSKIWRKLREVH